MCEDTCLREFVLGDSGFCPTSYMITPFDLRGRQEIESGMANYNRRVSKVRVEQTFGQLKKRFPILARRTDYGEQAMNKIINACCVLQNFVILCGESPQFCVLPPAELEDLQEVDAAEEANINLRNRQALVKHFEKNKDVICAPPGMEYEKFEIA